MRAQIRIALVLFLACMCTAPVYGGVIGTDVFHYKNNPAIADQGTFSFNEDRLSRAGDQQWKHNLGIQSGDMRDGEALGLSPSGGFGLHGLLGWSTVATAITTVVMGFVHPGDVHCGFAIASTSLAALACASGIYSYGFPTGDTKYTAHAMMGMLSTAGFATSIFLADRKSHAVLGGIAGVVFTVTVGVTYF